MTIVPAAAGHVGPHARVAGVAPLLGLRTRWWVLASVATLAVGSTVSATTLAAGPVLCPLCRLTGVPCPGCGLTRSCAACLHGDLGLSLSFHPFGPFVCAAALAVV